MAGECRACGMPLNAEDVFCGNCGQPAEMSRAHTAPTVESQINVGRAITTAASGTKHPEFYRRITRLMFTICFLICAVIYAFGVTFHSSATRDATLIIAIALIVLRASATFWYKSAIESANHHAKVVRQIARIGADAAFAREIIDALRVASPTSEGYLPAEIAGSVEDDPFLKATWQDAHLELQRLYAILGSPPIKTLTGARK